MNHRIPGLDGLRGVSIVLVIAGHLVNYRFAGEQPSGLWAFFAVLGVKIFFVISGFLITRLALHEAQLTGGFSLGTFYRRRIFRILPAYAAYLLAVTALSQAGLVDADPNGTALAAGFLCNVPGADCGWFVGHSWSLAYEEQFYLLFPLVFLAVPPGAKPAAFIGLHLVLALAGPLAVVLIGGDAAGQFSNYLGHFAAISAGVVCAVARDSLGALPHARRVSMLAWLCVAGCALVASGRIVHVRYEWRHAVETVLLSAAVAWLVYRVATQEGALQRAMEWPPLKFVGRLSYSLYLWQQLFTGVPFPGQWPLVLLLPAALLSYYGVEQPMQRLGRRLIGSVRPAAAGAQEGVLADSTVQR